MNRYFTFLFQFLIASFVLFFVYILFALADTEAGFDGIISFLIFQPIFGVIITLGTVILCSIIGLPVRLNNKFRKWWNKNFYFSIFGLVSGILLLGISFVSALTSTIASDNVPQKIIGHIPYAKTAIAGWFLTAFSILHFYPKDWIMGKSWISK